MFDVGFSELVLLFIIGLLVLGPERLPRVAAQLGRWVGRARRTATQLRLQFEREMAMQDIMKQQRKPQPRDSAKDSKNGASAQGDADVAPAETSSADSAAQPNASENAPQVDAPRAAPADADESR